MDTQLINQPMYHQPMYQLRTILIHNTLDDYWIEVIDIRFVVDTESAPSKEILVNE